MKLKLLEWRLVNDYPNGSVCPVYEAVSVFGTYRVSGAGRGYGGSDGIASWQFNGPGCSGRYDCSSVEHGKECAQADYERRVGELFENTNAIVDRVAKNVDSPVDIGAAVSLLDRVTDEYCCPCKIADSACCEGCSCKTPYSSAGCGCCARYGSREQRLAAANRIVQSLTEQSTDADRHDAEMFRKLVKLMEQATSYTRRFEAWTHNGGESPVAIIEVFGRRVAEGSTIRAAIEAAMGGES